jgi:hypothetical protein
MFQVIPKIGVIGMTDLPTELHEIVIKGILEHSFFFGVEFHLHGAPPQNPRNNFNGMKRKRKE